jgi:hypothetical protein
MGQFDSQPDSLSFVAREIPRGIHQNHLLFQKEIDCGETPKENKKNTKVVAWIHMLIFRIICLSLFFVENIPKIKILHRARC